MQPLKKSKDATPCCKICFKEIKCDAFHQIFSNQTICSNCIKNLKPEFIEFKIKNCKAIAIYRYDDVIKGMIFQYKGCHDYELKSVFLNYVKNFLKIMYFSYIIVPMPSYFKDDEIRGYNHVEEIFKELNLKMEKVLVNIYVPVLNSSYDMFIPQKSLMYDVLELIKKAVVKLSDGRFFADQNTAICRRDNAKCRRWVLIRSYPSAFI